MNDLAADYDTLADRAAARRADGSKSSAKEQARIANFAERETARAFGAMARHGIVARHHQSDFRSNSPKPNLALPLLASFLSRSGG